MWDVITTVVIVVAALAGISKFKSVLPSAGCACFLFLFPVALILYFLYFEDDDFVPGWLVFVVPFVISLIYNYVANYGETPKKNRSVGDETGMSEQESPDMSSTATVPEDLEQVMQELDQLIGLQEVKQQVHSLVKFIRVQQQRSQHQLKTSPISYHCVFSGSPGTGKTTVARILAKIYKELGIIREGHLIETDRAGLVAEYVGQTAIKTNNVVDSALGGVLFIDEAYSLYSESAEDYGREAIATLIKRMEDERDNLVVVMAGYTDEMKRFVDINPGLQSRFNRYIDFPDYTPDELLDIFKLYVKNGDFQMDETTENAVKQQLAKAYNTRDKSFGNARFVRNFFEKTIEKQSIRVVDISSPTAAQLMEILPTDVAEVD
ncbi:MAG: AAA family ATPase [Bacteroidales bacterium]|nr:AAA family ATPase [Bacteroidales bacterium]